MKKLFIHIPKTAGSAVLTVIGKNKNFVCKLHYDILRLNIQCVPEYKKMFSFCIVRDPYERIVSAYNFLKQKKTNINHMEKSYKEILSKYSSFADCIKDLETLQYKIVHFVPQHKFVCSEQGEILVNSVIRMENLSELEHIDPLFSNLPHTNKSCNDDFVLTNDMKKIIYHLYKQDFDIFQYSANLEE